MLASSQDRAVSDKILAGGLSLPLAGCDGHSTPSPVFLAKDRKPADFSIGGFLEPSWGSASPAPAASCYAPSLFLFHLGEGQDARQFLDRWVSVTVAGGGRVGPRRALLGTGPSPSSPWRRAGHSPMFGSALSRNRQANHFGARWSGEFYMFARGAYHTHSVGLSHFLKNSMQNLLRRFFL